MTVEFRYARFGEDSRIREFLDEYWARNHVYVRMPRLFDWTFGRQRYGITTDTALCWQKMQGR